MWQTLSAFRTLFAMIVIATTSISCPADAGAQPPGTDVYEWRPDLGGWLDTSRKLVWGYSMSDSTNSGFSFEGAKYWAARYPELLANQVEPALDRAEYCQQQANSLWETDPVRAQAYADLAAMYSQNAELFMEASLDAAQYSNWRLPTLTEFQDAFAKGLFSRGENGFNMDMSPGVGYQEGYGGTNWTSTTPKRIKGSMSALLFSITDGGTMWTGINSSSRALVVRSHTP
jgi:hypothetical protein